MHIAPRPRGAGFAFEDKVVGGAVPRRFIPAVGEAAEESARKGPLGYPGGRYLGDAGGWRLPFGRQPRHGVRDRDAPGDAGRAGEGRPDAAGADRGGDGHACRPSTRPGAQRLLTGRRGQILGYAAKEGWEGWDAVEALVPAAELQDFIIELRSQTQGLGSYTHRFDHLAEARHK